MPEVMDRIGILETFLRKKPARIAEWEHHQKVTLHISQIQKWGIEEMYSLIDKPDEYLGDLSVAAHRCGIPEDSPIEIIGYDHTTKIKDISSDHIGKLLALPGIIRSISEVRPRLIKGVYKCNTCGRAQEIEQIARQIRAGELHPGPCPSCRGRESTLQEEKSIYEDTQILTLSDAPEGLQGGEQPQQIVIEVWNELCGILYPGDRVILTGILRVRKAKDIVWFDKYLELNSISKSSDCIDFKITDEDIEKILALSKDPRIVSMVVDSIAPSIYGLLNVKRAIALQLFGGVPTTIGNDSRRGDIHVLLVGDPGVAKSQIILSAYHLSPRGIYTSGKSSSAAGLTAAAVKDETTGRWTLEAGALVFADGGMCAVDEIDKMNKSDRSALHEAMEQQTISVAKAGINAILRTRCSLLAAANPKMGRFILEEPLPQQINLSPPLLSRFDLIYIILDTTTGEQDIAMSSHILDVHDEERQGMEHLLPPIPSILLRKYITEAKKIFPKMSIAGKKIIQDYYVSMRKRVSKDSPVPITARQLESLIRLSQAHARIRMSPTIKEEDAHEAVQVLENCLKQVAFDRISGQFDIDMVYGTGKSQRDMMKIVLGAIRMIAEGKGSAKMTLEMDELSTYMMNEMKIPPSAVEHTVEMLSEQREVVRPNNRTVRLMNP